MSDLLAYLSSFLMGLILGIFGSGGTMFALPILTYFYNVPPVHATSYSLIIVFVVSLIGVIRIRDTGNIIYDKALYFLIPSVITVFISRVFLVPMIPENFYVFNIQFSNDTLIVVLLSLLMLLSAYMLIIKHDNKKNITSCSNYVFYIQGVVIGFITSIVGAGGGFLIAPTFMIFNNFNAKQSTATSLFIVCLNSLSGVIGDFILFNDIDMTIIFIMFFFGSIGMYFSNYVSSLLPEIILKLLYVLILITVAISILLEQIKLIL